MKTVIKAYCVYRQLYGYLCYDGFHYDDLGWYRQDEIPAKGVSILWFRTKKEADCWRNRLPMNKKGWFGVCDTETKEVRLTIETGGDLIWD